MTDTRLTPARYLELLHVEGERLLNAAEDRLDLPVPTCEGWTVDDAVFHVGSVYAHKRAVLRLGRRPEPGEWQEPEDDASPEDDLSWCHVMLHGLAAELAGRNPGEPAWTWWAPEQTVGFWQRRMALETAVHRADVESASGAITPVDADLALDGIDEVLVVNLGAADFAGVASMSTSGDEVVVHLDAVSVSGGASEVLLWLWGRLPDDAVTLTGTPLERQAVRAILKDAAQ